VRCSLLPKLLAVLISATPSGQFSAIFTLSSLPLALAFRPASSMHSKCAHCRPLGSVKSSWSVVGFLQNRQTISGVSLSFIVIPASAGLTALQGGPPMLFTA
jgi:hypothetical protein